MSFIFRRSSKLRVFSSMISKENIERVDTYCKNVELYLSPLLLSYKVARSWWSDKLMTKKWWSYINDYRGPHKAEGTLVKANNIKMRIADVAYVAFTAMKCKIMTEIFSTHWECILSLCVYHWVTSYSRIDTLKKCLYSTWKFVKILEIS